jgi:hypothetical protein
MMANALFLVMIRLAGLLGWEWLTGVPTALPRFFQLMVLTHTGIGLTLAMLVVAFFLSHLPVVWRRRHRASVLSGLALVLVASTLTVTGLFILTDAASRDNRWAWALHVLCAATVIAGYLQHRYVNRTRPLPRQTRRVMIGIVGVALVLVVLHGLGAADTGLTPEAQLALDRGVTVGAGSRDRARPGSEEDFVPSGFVSPASPFFPSPATTTSGWYLPARIITRGESPETVKEEVEEEGFASDSIRT